MFKLPSKYFNHPLSYVCYKALIKQKKLFRLDFTICLTMSCVCFGFSIILFYEYIKVSLI